MLHAIGLQVIKQLRMRYLEWNTISTSLSLKIPHAYRSCFLEICMWGRVTLERLLQSSQVLRMKVDLDWSEKHSHSLKLQKLSIKSHRRWHWITPPVPSEPSLSRSLFFADNSNIQICMKSESSDSHAQGAMESSRCQCKKYHTVLEGYH